MCSCVGIYPCVSLTDSSLRQLARLLVCNFRALEHGYTEADDILRTLTDLPIIPLADGSVVALRNAAVFFPMEEAKTKKKKAQAQAGNLEDIHTVIYSLTKYTQYIIIVCMNSFYIGK